MNMNKALQNLYKAVSGEDNNKVNITKLLLDVHYAITGKESANKNNWSRIVDSMATNWPSGGGGSSDFSTAEVTFTIDEGIYVNAPEIYEDHIYVSSFNHDFSPVTADIVLYKGEITLAYDNAITFDEACYVTATSGGVSYENGVVTITGDGSITLLATEGR